MEKIKKASVVAEESFDNPLKKRFYGNTKKYVYRATSILFMFALFGALCAGLVITLKLIFHTSIPDGRALEIFRHLTFWATDFCFIGFVLILSYLIAGLPAIAPSLTLSIYFCHFAGLYNDYSSSLSMPLYIKDYGSALQSGGVNIGYLGYLIMALLLGYSIKMLFRLWNYLKETVGPKLDGLMAALSKKIKPLESIGGGKGLLEQLDLLMFYLILPPIALLLTYFVIQYCIAIPFNALAVKLGAMLTNIYTARKTTLGGLVMGLMVGFDVIGPISMSAFDVAANMTAGGSAVAMTTFSVCFVSLCWTPFLAVIISRIIKKGGHYDNDDFNIVVSGPINAAFDNMKLTVLFSMIFSYRDPIRCTISYMVGGAVTGILAGAVKLENAKYLLPERVEQYLSGEKYVSILQPLRSISATPKGILLPIFVAIGSIVGAFVYIFIKELAVKRQKKHHTYEEFNDDLVIEMREYAETC